MCAMRLRLAITISGAVSLGAYEAGAVAALLQGLRSECTGPDPAVRVDAIGGASAGAITGLLAARTLLEGLDPLRVMEAGWVALPSLATLRTKSMQAPLTADGLRAAAETLLAVPVGVNGEPSAHRQQVPVRLAVALTNLRALDYQLARQHGRPPVTALTHLDWSAVELRAGLPVEALTGPAHGSVLDAVLASAANALGFPPVLLDRRVDRSAYEANGIRNFPESGFCWYTDGGTVDNEPLGRTLDVAGLLDRDAGPDVQRVQLLIHPDPTSSPTGDEWADPGARYSWLEVLRRVEKLQGIQTLYDDLRTLERTNTRLRWLDDLQAALAPVLGRLDAASSEAVRAALLEVAGRIAGERQHFDQLHAENLGEAHVGPGAAAEARVVGARPAPMPLRHVVDHLSAEAVADLPLGALFERVSAEVSGLSGKRAVALEVISPEAIAREAGKSVDELLAGAFLGHFGGFLDERLRASDFDLGYESTLRWFESGGLAAHGVTREVCQRAAAEARRAKALHDRAHRKLHPSQPWKRWGGTTMARLSWRAKLGAARVALKAAEVAAYDLWPLRRRK
jgi:predicted acylesterase/phospholipase RssA